jgi:hypothetical protein
LNEPLKKFCRNAPNDFYGERYDLRAFLILARRFQRPPHLIPARWIDERLHSARRSEGCSFPRDEVTLAQYRLAKSVGLSEGYKIPADFRTMIRQKSAVRGVVRADEFDVRRLKISVCPAMATAASKSFVRNACVVGGDGSRNWPWQGERRFASFVQ